MPPLSEPANNQFLRPIATDRSARSADSALLDTAGFADSGAPLVALPAAAPLHAVVVDEELRPACPIAKALAPEVAVAPLTTAPRDIDAWLRTHGELRYLAQHRMEPGETAWAIGQDIGVPLWVLRELNPHQDLDRLLVGDWVVFPITNTNVERASAWYTEEDCGC